MAKTIDFKNMHCIERDALYRKKSRRAVLGAIICALLALIAFIIYLIFRNVFSAKTVSEIYTEKIFYYISWPIKKLAGFFPFSMAEIALYVLIISIAVMIFLTLLNTGRAVVFFIMCKRRGLYCRKILMFRPAILLGLRLTAIICAIITLFISFGGINYTGQTFAERAGYAIEDSDVSDLIQLCVVLGRKTSESREYVVTDLKGAIDENYKPYNPFRLINDAEKAYKNLPEEYEYLKRDYPSVKPAVGSILMSNIHISGIYPYVFPEAIVNIYTPIMSLPHTICHEMAHQRGFAREDEANYIAYLACIQSDNPLIVYSGYYTAFSYAMNQLYVYDYESWATIKDYVNPDIISDMRRENTYWKQFETIDNKVTESVNDVFLEIMDVRDGVHSYGRMVDLLIAEAKKHNEI